MPRKRMGERLGEGGGQKRRNVTIDGVWPIISTATKVINDISTQY